MCSRSARCGNRLGFTIVAVLTLALGIGANAAIFSLINAVLLRPLPFANADRIASISESATGLGFPQIPFSPPDLHEFMARQRSFESVAAYENDHRELSGDGGAGERIVETRSAPRFSRYSASSRCLAAHSHRKKTRRATQSQF